MKVRHISFFCFAVLVGMTGIVACSEDDPAESDCDSYTYDADIKSIVDMSCATAYCHGSGSAAGDWTSYDLLKSALDDGSFNSAVLVNKTMPKGSSLDDSQLESIRCWYEAGYPEK